ncbi:GGDEF domain-containing protein [Inconstantimicrobium mannanitabidum]|uniref:GGDEF domain-containing protein n=1 Tax=Inconstantimicrobium mannanitabidum TaxID=1604901 RepID=A0ACB5RGX3_9CLOT|nr:GGDEF domain-containing protein [Clostridium sp. TW13]GKX68328.1 GGDEF domain-containing protein [Clostridium sp. TW13]
MINLKGDSFTYLRKMFDSVRIVNPNDCSEISILNNDIECKNRTESCYRMWGKGTKCNNCISSRAYNEDGTFIKFECSGEKTYLVMAMPIIDEGKKYIIETIKEIKDGRFIYGEENFTPNQLYEKIQHNNELIILDELTGAFNRRYINENLPTEVSKAIISNNTLSLAMLDLDDFKMINDTYNHAMGDFIIKEFVKVVKENIRRHNDWIARYGGEEFIIVFRNTDKEEAYTLCERIRKAVQEHVFFKDNIKIDLTVSFGISTIAEDVNNSELLLKNADDNLYKAKDNGKNRVEKD